MESAASPSIICIKLATTDTIIMMQNDSTPPRFVRHHYNPEQVPGRHEQNTTDPPRRPNRIGSAPRTLRICFVRYTTWRSVSEMA
mmetsp:Transcript_2464/g.3517  ORF Transcript_2464/g.3517 Transcript_2464/m.3517 type:complete len:85 (-) Transcript_2464:1336-1590(-)